MRGGEKEGEKEGKKRVGKGCARRLPPCVIKSRESEKGFLTVAMLRMEMDRKFCDSCLVSYFFIFPSARNCMHRWIEEEIGSIPDNIANTPQERRIGVMPLADTVSLF